tara:strand:+ start:267 stop:596 length:330 start_codon:yes stop_codon:yes gene_type:complete
MKKYNLSIIFLGFLLVLSACQTIQDGMVGNKRSKSGDEFLVHKKKPLVVPPDFEIMPPPKQIQKTEEQASVSTESIEDILNIKKEETENSSQNNNSSLEESILKKIKSN